MAVYRETSPSEQLSWSQTEFELVVFLDMFKLPQVVQISEGNYGTSESTTLPIGQILTLHTVKQTKMLRGHTYEGEEVLLPINNNQKVEIRPQNVGLIYETVADLCLVLDRVKYVRVTRSNYESKYPERCIKADQKLRIEYIENGGTKKEALICIDEVGLEYCLPMHIIGGFQPLLDNNEYFLLEILEEFQLPLYIQFTNKKSTNPSGLIYVEDVYVDHTVISSTKEGDRKTIITFPRTLDVDVRVCKEALAPEDNTYARVCASLTDGVDLLKVEQLAMSHERIIYGKMPEVVREFEYDSALRSSERSNSQSSRTSSLLDVEDTLDDIYEEIDDDYLTPFGRQKVFEAREKSTEDVHSPTKDTGGDMYHSNIDEMTIKQIGFLLSELNMGEYIDLFEAQQVNGSMLKDLDRTILEAKPFNMMPYHALKLIKATEEHWRPNK